MSKLADMGTTGLRSAGAFCSPKVPVPAGAVTTRPAQRATVGLKAGYLDGPDDMWDNLFYRVQGSKLDPAVLFKVTDPASADVPANWQSMPERWTGFVDGVTYGGARGTVTGGVLGVVLGALGLHLFQRYRGKHHGHR